MSSFHFPEKKKPLHQVFFCKKVFFSWHSTKLKNRLFLLHFSRDASTREAAHTPHNESVAANVKQNETMVKKIAKSLAGTGAIKLYFQWPTILNNY
jgi:hypothetical protein